MALRSLRGDACGCARLPSARRARLQRTRAASLRPRAAAGDEPPQQESQAGRDAQQPGAAEAVVWGGNLPSGRRVLLGSLGASGIALGGNFCGVTSALLGTNVEEARALRLDVLFPVGGCKRVLNTGAGYELLVPKDWLADQTVARRKAMQAELSRGPLDPPSLRGAAARRVEEPDAAWGPPGSTGEQNLSVIVANANAFGVLFTLASMGAAQDVAERLLANVIARPGSGKTATLLSARERRAESGSGLPFYDLEFIVRSEAQGWERHNLSTLYGAPARH
jgi:hypothetical protein